MPRRDGTGPMGDGRIGRGMGGCFDEQTVFSGKGRRCSSGRGFARGLGGGQGLGQGLNRGLRQQGGNFRQSFDASEPALDKQARIEALERELKALKNES